MLDPLPERVVVRRRLAGTLRVILLFVVGSADLRRKLPAAVRALPADGGLWIAWPKRSSGVSTDLDGAAVRERGLAAGLVDNKVCAIDETWSAHRFVVRREDREAWTAARDPAADRASS